MRTGVFTALAVGLLSAWVTAQSVPQPILRADHVVMLKKERTLELLSQGKAIKTYKVALGGDPVGPKTRQGDHKTPEGAYVLDFRNAHSEFYKSIHISYPSEHDRVLARQKAVSPGGDVFVHGLPKGYGWLGSSHRLRDWTDGCIAVTNEEMDEIWKAVPVGTPIEIRRESGARDPNDGNDGNWWTWPGSNRRPLPCHGSALPAAPQAHDWKARQVGIEGSNSNHFRPHCRDSQRALILLFLSTGIFCHN